MALQQFLIVYDLIEARLLHVAEFGEDLSAATAAYARKEPEYRNRRGHADYEIMLIGADSLDTLRITHPRYFRGNDVLAGHQLPGGN